MEILLAVLGDVAGPALHLARTVSGAVLSALPWWFWPVVFCGAMARTVGHYATAAAARPAPGRRRAPPSGPARRKRRR